MTTRTTHPTEGRDQDAPSPVLPGDGDVSMSASSGVPGRLRLRGRLLGVLAAVVVLVLACGSVAAAHWNAGVNTALSASAESLSDAGDSLTAARDAASVTLEQDATEADPALVAQLRHALEAPAPVPATTGSRQARTSANQATADDAAAAAAAITTLTATVHQSAESARLAAAKTAYDTATNRLDTALASARSLLTASTGKVADDAVRQALSAAIATAQQARTTPPPATTPAYQAAATAAEAQVTALTAASSAVATAQAAWQKQQDTTTATAAATTPGKTSSTSSSTSKKTSSSTTKKSSSSTSGSKGASCTPNGTTCVDINHLPPGVTLLAPGQSDPVTGDWCGTFDTDEHATGGWC